MSYIVLIDSREHDGECRVLLNDREQIAQFVEQDEAEARMETHPLGELPFMIVNLDTAEVVN